MNANSSAIKYDMKRGGTYLLIALLLISTSCLIHAQCVEPPLDGNYDKIADPADKKVCLSPCDDRKGVNVHVTSGILSSITLTITNWVLGDIQNFGIQIDGNCTCSVWVFAKDTLLKHPQNVSTKLTAIGYITADPLCGGPNPPAVFYSEEFTVNFQKDGCKGSSSGCGGSPCLSGAPTFSTASVENNQGPDVSFNLGRLSLDESAGFLEFKFEEPSALLAQPAALNVPFDRSGPSGTVEVIRDGSDVIQQVRVPDGLVHVKVVNPYKYELQMFYDSDVGSLDGGLYETNGPAFVVWTIENPDTTNNNNRLTIAEIRNGSLQREFTFIYTNISSIPQWWLTESGNSGTIIATWEAADSMDNTLTNVVREIRTEGMLVQRTERIYTNLNDRMLLIKSIEGEGSLVRETSYTHDEDGNIQLVTYSDGNWEYFQYDGLRRVIRKFSAFGNSPPPTSNPYANPCRIIEYSYTPLVPGDGTTNMTPKPDLARLESHYAPILTESNWSSAEVSRIYRSCPEMHEVVEWRCVTPFSCDWDNPTNQWSRTVQYSSTVTNKAGRPHFEVHVNGTITLHDYVFTNGILAKTIVQTGEADVGGLLTNVPTAVINGQQTETEYDSLGKILSRTVRAITNNTLSIVLSQETYTHFGPLQQSYQVVNLAGRTNEYQYACCGLESFTDGDGIVTLYEYDEIKRQVASTVLRGGGSGVKTTNVLDSLGRILQTKRIGTDNTIITLVQNQYDVLGNLVRQTNSLGGVTTTFYGHADGRAGVTNIYPDGGTRIELYYRDGRLEQMLGTAVSPIRYVHGVERDGGGGPYREFTLEIRLAVDSGSNEWTKTYVDGVGQAYKMFHSAPSEPFPSNESHYNSHAQLWKKVDAEGVATFYVYDSEGHQEYAIIGITNTTREIARYEDLLDEFDNLKGGPDRITQTNHFPVPAEGGKPDLVRNETYIWNDGSATGTLVSRSEKSTDGLKTWNTVYPDPSTPVTSSSAINYGPSGWRTNRMTASEGSYTLSLLSYGRLVSTIRKDSLNAQLSALSYFYDAHGRQTMVTDARNGATTYTFNNADQVVTTTSPDPANGFGRQVTTVFYDLLGRNTGTRHPDATTTTNLYYPNGLLQKTWGSRVYPVGYGYDAQGRMRYMTNWQSFSINSGTSITRWNYDAYRGWLASKDYPDASTGNPPGTEGSSGPVYTHTDAGRLLTRTWKRGVVTTYAYNEAGDLLTIGYSDSTAAVTNSYNRLGRKTEVVCAGMTNLFVYNNTGQVLSNGYSSGTLVGLVVTNGYDHFLRRTNQTALSSNSQLLSAMYGYDAASRLAMVSNATAGVSATYSYLANSPLVEHITFKSNAVTRMTTTKQYDVLNRLTSIFSANSQLPSPISYSYHYNQANQRTRRSEADGSYWVYNYDDLGQVVSGKRYWSDGTPVAGQQYEYGFDDIGNRKNTATGGDQSSAGLRPASYSVNRLNQYTQRDVPAYVDILGIANPTASVTVNGNTAYRKGEYFRYELGVNNSSAAQYPTVTVNSTYGAQQSESGKVFLPKTPETFGYDADGNMTNDGRWAFTWDGENRLVKMESLSSAPSGSKLKLEFVYDCQSRRIQKLVSTNNGSAYFPLYTNRFLYDGWNLLAELTPSHSALRTYTWGLDLSGSEQGAGGVGGLLMVSNTGNGTHFPAYDGNGNVTALVNAGNGAASATYEYGPFSEPVRTSGAMAKANPFRFSTKFTDDETGLLNYGYRYYDSSTGRWVGRDPIAEQGFRSPIKDQEEQSSKRAMAHLARQESQLLREFGGLNLYSFVFNNAINRRDMLGLFVDSGVKVCSEGGWKLVRHEWLEYDGGSAGFYPGSSGIWPGGPGEVESPDTHANDADKQCLAVGLPECCNRDKFLKCIKDRIAQDQDLPPWYAVPVSTCSWWTGNVVSECLKVCK